MHIERKVIFDRELSYAGSMDNKNIVLIIGRNNYSKESKSLKSILFSLHDKDLTFIWYESKSRVISDLLTKKSEKYIESKICKYFIQYPHIYGLLRKLIKGIILLGHPFHWNYFWNRSNYIAYQSEELYRFIESFTEKNWRNIFLLSHSAGGIISSLIANKSNIKKLICFGYPFKHPDNKEDPKRTNHLKYISKPFLIIQGKEDAYGNINTIKNYQLSSSINLLHIDDNHDYSNISNEECNQIIGEIKDFFSFTSA